MGEQRGHPVLALLRARLEARDRPGARHDPHRLGLAIQGGGMRGVISGGMLAALEDLGLGHAFDGVYGSSSGALNGAYSYAGDNWKQLAIYWEHLTDRRFIDPFRALRGNLIGLDYAFSYVVSQAVPLDADAVLDSKVPLTVAVTLVDELRTEAVSTFRDRADLLAALRASAWLPLAVRGTATFRGRRAIDGALLTVHPCRLALLDGCTHVLSLSTRPHGPYQLPGRLLRSVQHRALERLCPGLGARHLDALEEYVADRAVLSRRTTTPDEQPYVYDLAPSRPLHALEQSRAKLIAAATDARDLTLRELGGAA
jgi:predicted patatin/cPLA2 family phospholipase